MVIFCNIGSTQNKGRWFPEDISQFLEKVFSCREEFCIGGVYSEQSIYAPCLLDLISARFLTQRECFYNALIPSGRLQPFKEKSLG